MVNPYEDLEFNKRGEGLWRLRTNQQRLKAPWSKPILAKRNPLEFRTSPITTFQPYSDKEQRWDTRVPTSDVSLSKVNSSKMNFDRSIDNRKTYQNRMNVIDARVKVIREEIDAETDPTVILTLAQERNSLIMERSILESNDEAAKKNAELHLKTMHTYRDSVGDFFIDGPHTTENRAVLGSLLLAGAVAYGMYYLLIPTGPRRRAYRSLFSESPVSGAFGGITS